MRVIISECVRYFEKPLCFRMPPDHVHTSRCWDQEFHELRERLFNAESDVRALEQANKLLKQENFALKERLNPSRTGGVHGPSPSLVSMDEAAVWDKIRDFGDLDKKAVEALMAMKSTTVANESDIDLRRVVRPDDTVAFQTADGKFFANKSQAARHAALLRKRP